MSMNCLQLHCSPWHNYEGVKMAMSLVTWWSLWSSYWQSRLFVHYSWVD